MFVTLFIDLPNSYLQLKVQDSLACKSRPLVVALRAGRTFQRNVKKCRVDESLIHVRTYIEVRPADIDTAATDTSFAPARIKRMEQEVSLAIDCVWLVTTVFRIDLDATRAWAYTRTVSAKGCDRWAGAQGKACCFLQALEDR